MLHFIRMNFKNTPRSVIQTLYISFIRPILVYACVIWDPLKCYAANTLERIQNWALRIVPSDYSPYSRCTEIKKRLGWNLHKCRRICLRLKCLYNIYSGRQVLQEIFSFFNHVMYPQGGIISVRISSPHLLFFLLIFFSENRPGVEYITGRFD